MLRSKLFSRKGSKTERKQMRIFINNNCNCNKNKKNDKNQRH